MKTESASETTGGPSLPRRSAGCPANVLSEAAYERFRLLARERIGLEFTGARRPDLERAVARAVAELRLPSDDALYHLLTASGDGRAAFDRLAAELTVCETHFFRNRPQFETLERHILPELIRRRRPLRRLRLWSAGCATGEEPYSLAILVRRLLPDLADWDVLILATDVNRDVLARARRGVFGAWSFREVPADIQRTCFERVGSQWEILPQIRDLVTFAHLNMVQGGYPAPASNTHDMDLILCRNMLIYFDEQTTQRVVGRLYTALTDGGWLVVGHAEPSLTTFRQFATRNLPGTVVYQKVAHEGPQPLCETADENIPCCSGRSPDRARCGSVGDRPQPGETADENNPCCSGRSPDRARCGSVGDRPQPGENIPCCSGRSPDRARCGSVGDRPQPGENNPCCSGRSPDRACCGSVGDRPQPGENNPCCSGRSPDRARCGSVGDRPQPGENNPCCSGRSPDRARCGSVGDRPQPGENNPCCSGRSPDPYP